MTFEIENEVVLFKGQRISAKMLLFRVSKKNNNQKSKLHMKESLVPGPPHSGLGGRRERPQLTY